MMCYIWHMPFNYDMLAEHHYHLRGEAKPYAVLHLGVKLQSRCILA